MNHHRRIFWNHHSNVPECTKHGSANVHLDGCWACEAEEDDVGNDLKERTQRVTSHLDEFMECYQCAAKPGSPTLCRRCLHNRDLVERLRREAQHKAQTPEQSLRRIKTLEERLRKIQEVARGW